MRTAPPEAAAGTILFVDLDSVLATVDLSWEALAGLCKARPWCALALPAWLFQGKNHAKKQIAQRARLNAARLLYRNDVLEFLRAEKEAGTALVLAAAPDRMFAKEIAEHLGLFSAVLGGDDAASLEGRRKLAEIQELKTSRIHGPTADAPLGLSLCRMADGTGLLARPARDASPAKFTALKLRSVWRALRPRQWAKNLLVFLPFLLAHLWGDLDSLGRAFGAFVSFSLCASGVYVVNDLLDLEADRAHPRKRDRPFASGALPIWSGLLLGPALVGAGLLSAGLFSAPLAQVVAIYSVAAVAYSIYLKQILIVDVVVLAGLYALRILAGGAAANVFISPWLVAFSLFLFFSLAFVKRYSEIVRAQGTGAEPPLGRGYLRPDIDLIRTAGLTSGYLAVLVLALYVNSKEVMALYRNPQMLWMACPLLIYWISRVWFLANRGVVDDDPLTFALADSATYAVGVLLALAAFMAI